MAQRRGHYMNKYTPVPEHTQDEWAMAVKEAEERKSELPGLFQDDFNEQKEIVKKIDDINQNLARAVINMQEINSMLWYTRLPQKGDK